MNRLQNKIALITGGNTGIGRAVALAYANEGADVAIAYHGHQVEANSLKEEIIGKGHRCLLVHVEVTEESSVQSMVDEVRNHFGRIDVFVNNAGTQKAQ